MTNELQIYKFAPGMNLRTVVIDGEPWYVAKDVCASLGFRDASNATRGLSNDKKTRGKVSTLGGSQSQTLISESGLYMLIFRSNKPEARQFTNWVTSAVLPAIRRDGGYVMGEEKVATGEMCMDDMIVKVTSILKTKMQDLARERTSVAGELTFVTPN